MPYLNLGKFTPDDSLYRITTIERLVGDLEAGRNVLVRPELWEDPLEGAILRAYGRLDSGGTVMFRLRRNYFAQCWSIHRETDLMWRAYSPERNGVKLRVRACDLYGGLATYSQERAAEPGRTAQAYLGRVRYKRKERFHRIMREGCDFGAPGESQAQTLLIKRFGFRSEREVRLIAYAEEEAPDNLLSYPVDWNSLMAEAVLDPRMPREAADDAKLRIAAAGFSGKVVQSSLYRRPPPLYFDLGR